MNKPSLQYSEKNAPPLCFFPSWLFFAENIPADASATLSARREQVALHLESFSPVPAEQLLSGFVSRTHGDSILCYAAARERCRERLEKIPAKTLHCLPPFALWDNAGTAAPRWEWLATRDELTAILIEPDNAFPARVHSWEIRSDALPEETFRTALRTEYEQRKKEIEAASPIEHKEGIYLLGEQSIDAKKNCGEVRLQRFNADGSVVPAARVLRFSLNDDSLWDADIRDAATLSRKRKERKNALLCKRLFSLCGFVAVLLAIAQILLWIFEYKTEKLVEEENAQRPHVAAIRSQAKLINDISKIQENKLQTIRTVAVLNAQRPNGVGFSNFGGNGTAGTVSVTGSAESIALAKEFEKNLHACGLFKDIVFTANIASAGANFSLQCRPDKNAIAEIDFYDSPEKENAAENEEAASGKEATSENAPEPVSEDESADHEPAGEGDKQ